MKKNRKYLISIIILLFSFSCEIFNDKQNCSNNLIIEKPDDHLISQDELTTIMFLFDKNNLESNTLQFYKLQNDELGYHHVRCNQFINGLKVFDSPLIFHFNNSDTLYRLTGNIIFEINNDTIPSMNQEDVINLFINELNKDEECFCNKEEISNNCFDLEFGYFNLSFGQSNLSEDYVKAWKVSSQISSHVAYINDETSEIIYYFNGIIY
jgi:Zn-dependent metalloprotease